MGIIARGSITVTNIVDISSVTWYYKLQASTASPPSKPTTATPSGWSTTEPTYTEGSTNSLYVCQKTTFSDGTFEYSDVSLSSSYEAAKTAYNKGVAALSAANGKNKNFYLPSTTTPTGAVAGDQWFKTDKGMELYKYNGTSWEKVGFSSAIFSNATVGNAIVGKLDSLLIYNDDDYWNLSGASFDANFLPTSVEADIKYRANTLRTHHLWAENDIYVDGGPDSYLRIPTENDDLSYVEMSNGGMTVVARTQLENSLYELTTLYPSISVIDHTSDTTTDLLESPLVDYKVFGEISNSTMVYTKIAEPLDPHEYYEYNVIQGVKEVKFTAEAGTFDQNDEKVKDDANAATYGAYGILIEYDENGTGDWERIFQVDESKCEIGSLMMPMGFIVNGKNAAHAIDGYESIRNLSYNATWLNAQFIHGKGLVVAIPAPGYTQVVTQSITNARIFRITGGWLDIKAKLTAVRLLGGYLELVFNLNTSDATSYGFTGGSTCLVEISGTLTLK